jgi:hypothetical protein
MFSTWFAGPESRGPGGAGVLGEGGRVNRVLQRRWRIFWLCFSAALALLTFSQAATVYLTGYVSYSLFGSNGSPLSNGCIVMIFGSYDNVNDGIGIFGGTNYVANSTQNDDVYLGWVRIGQPSYMGSNGTFYTAYQISFDDTVVQYLYLRFFDTTNYPVQGFVPWGTSAVFGYTSQFGYAEVDFVGNYITTMTNNFVIIPEPSTAHLMLLFAGMVAGLHGAMRRSKMNQSPDQVSEHNRG